MVELTEAQLAVYPPELRPVAKRHGLALLNFALIVAGTNRACDELLQLGERFVKARIPATVVLNNMSTLCELILKAYNWDMDQVQEVIADVGRAQDLASGRPQILLH